MVLCARETSRCPRTVLGQDRRHVRRSPVRVQARVRGSTRYALTTSAVWENLCLQVRRHGGARPAFFHLRVRAAYNTVYGASGGHGLHPLLGERLHHGGDATAWTGVAQCQVQGPDGSCDMCWRWRRMVLGSLRACLGPGSLGSVGAIPPRREPACRAGQRSTDSRNRVLRKGWVDGLVTTGSGALGPRPCLGKERWSLSEHEWFSLAWHTP